MRTRVKICCISSTAEAHAAIAAGADALGLVSAMPSGPGVIEEALIAEIAAAAPPAIGTFLLTSEVEPAAIVAQQRRCGVNTIQLCDAPHAGAYPALRAALPGVALIQAIHVREESAVAEAAAVAPMVNGLLLDSGNPRGAVKELGGTGRVHDWTLSRRIVASVACPVFLAGGLNAGNAAEAIRQVRPYGVDLCTGVRSEGALDRARLGAFMGAVAASDGERRLAGARDGTEWYTDTHTGGPAGGR